MQKLLRIDSGHFVAGAVWQRKDNHWACIMAAPIIKWMVGKNPAKVKMYLQDKGWMYTWHNVKEEVI